jgi:hypothetical protein
MFGYLIVSVNIRIARTTTGGYSLEALSDLFLGADRRKVNMKDRFGQRKPKRYDTTSFILFLLHSMHYICVFLYRAIVMVLKVKPS